MRVSQLINDMKLLIFSVLCAVILTQCDGSKILAFFPLPIGSHYIINSRIVNELVSRGHEVTHVTPFPQKNPPKNLKEIPTKADFANDHKRALLNLAKESALGLALFVCELGTFSTELILKTEEIQKLLQSKEKYDVVIMPQFVNEAWLGIAQHLQAPVVQVATMPLFPWASFLFAHPSSPAYVPNLVIPYSGHMNFWQRLMNSFHNLYMITYHQWVVLPKHRDLVKKYVPGQLDLYDFLNNASLLLINSHVSIYDAKPQVPNAIEIGGAHIQEAKKLPEDLQKFLDDSTEGVVIFSLGSNVKSSDLSDVARDGIFKAFSKLKQRVLCKWETEEVPGKPQNVKLMKWLPQSDILAHPNVKVLISHGGLLSTMESIYYGVPIIGIPLFGDQRMNIATAVSLGYAVHLPLQELSEEILSKSLDQVLNDPRYRTNARKRSKIMRDRPMKPMDTAMYWIEYVIRHQGAPHLKYPGAELTWYQRDLLDVIAVVFVAIFLAISAVIVLLRQILRRIFRVPDKNKKND